MCPVCGFRGLSEPPYDKHGFASFEICPCCGTEFGYDDANKSFDELRAAWIAAGMPWYNDTSPPPDEWDGRAQLGQAGLTPPASTDTMQRSVALSVLHLGKALAAAMDCRDPQRSAWVGVYPLDLSSPLTRQFLTNNGLSIFPSRGRAYHVRTFEVDRALVETDASIGETELTNAQSFFAFDDDTLTKKLEELGVPLEKLERPFKSDYPI